MKTEKKPFTATFPQDLIMEMDARAHQLDMSRSQFLRHLVRQEISGHKPKEKQDSLPLGHAA